MAYAKTTWVTGDLITAIKLNHLETQFDEILSSANTLAAIQTFSANPLISKTRPELQLLHSGSKKGRLLMPDALSIDHCHNLSFDGTNWNLDDTSAAGSRLALAGDQVIFYYASAGSNPRTLVEVARHNADIFDLKKGQLKFPSTQNPSSDVNTLDDYEEGTWTPSDQSGDGLTFTSPNGHYVKWGRWVAAIGNLQYPITASSTLSNVGGFPFTSDTGPSGWPVTYGYNDSGTSLAGYLNTSDTKMLIYAAGGVTRRTNAQLSASTMMFRCIYRASN